MRNEQIGWPKEIKRDAKGKGVKGGSGNRKIGADLEKERQNTGGKRKQH